MVGCRACYYSRLSHVQSEGCGIRQPSTVLCLLARQPAGRSACSATARWQAAQSGDRQRQLHFGLQLCHTAAGLAGTIHLVCMQPMQAAQRGTAYHQSASQCGQATRPALLAAPLAASAASNHGQIWPLARYLTFRSCSARRASSGQRRPELSRPDLPRPTHLESCSGHAATSLRTWLIHLGPVCLAASPRSWMPADLFFIRAIPHHCLLCRVQGLST